MKCGLLSRFKDRFCDVLSRVEANVLASTHPGAGDALVSGAPFSPAGKNLLDGRYAEFGYTVENAELLADVKEGDVIKSAKILGGMENWKASA